MAKLSPEQLTGRVRTHVREVPELPGLRCWLHPAAALAFLGLRARARHVGIDLVPVSTFRDFEQQLAIWNAKFRGQRPLLDGDERPLDAAAMTAEQLVSAILQWSALPGASRHHWGTEIDVIDRAALLAGQPAQLLSAHYAPGGPFELLGAWLPQQCGSYGFFQPYDSDRGGVRPEPWHLSYAPVADGALAALTPEVVQAALEGGDLAGAEVVRRRLRDIHRQYVCAVAHPASPALAAARLNPATRPS